MKNSEQLIKLLQETHLQIRDCLVGFDVGSLATNVPVEEVSHVIQNWLNMDRLCKLKSNGITGHQFNNYVQPAKRGHGNWKIAISGGQSHIYETLIGNSNGYSRPQTVRRLRYVDSTFMVWPHGLAKLQQFLHHLNNHIHD